MKAKNLKKKTHKKRGVANKEPVLVECSIKQISLIDSLLETSIIPQKEYEYLYQKFKGFLSEGEAEYYINYLNENQRDNISSGFRYSANEIKKKLSQ